MAEPLPSLTLVSPPLADPGPFALRLAEACGVGDVAAVLLRLEEADERTLVNRIKAIAPAAQGHGAAVMIELLGEGADLALVAARSGADGVHWSGAAEGAKPLRERLRDERMLGIGSLRSKHDAMSAGEVGADYVMFGEPRPDGSVPPLDAVADRAAWWAPIFETPCIAYAPDVAAVRRLARTGAEFVAFGGDGLWSHAEGPATAVAEALAALTQAREVA